MGEGARADGVLADECLIPPGFRLEFISIQLIYFPAGETISVKTVQHWYRRGLSPLEQQNRDKTSSSGQRGHNRIGGIRPEPAG